MHLIIDATSTQDQMKHAGIGRLAQNLTENIVRLFPFHTFSILLFNNAESTLNIEKLRALPNVEIEYLGRFSVSSYLNEIMYYLQFIPAIKRVLSAHEKEEVKYLSLHFARHFPSKLLPTAVFIHDFALPLLNSYSQKSFIHNAIRKIQYWRALNGVRQSALVFTNIGQTKKKFLEFYSDYDEKNVYDVPLGIELEINNVDIRKLIQKYSFPNDLADRRYFIYLGGEATATKNSEGVVRGYYDFYVKYKQENKKGKIPYLLIAGKEFLNFSRKDVDALHKLISDLGIKKNVLFTGYYLDEERFAFLNNALAFVHLSHYEGFGLALGEAMRSSTPVVASNIAAHAYVLGDEETGILVDGMVPSETGDALLQLVNDPAFRNQIAKKGYNRSLSFHWEDMAKKVGEKLLEE